MRISTQGSELLFDLEHLALCMKYVIIEFSVNWARTFTVRMPDYNLKCAGHFEVAADSQCL